MELKRFDRQEARASPQGQRSHPGVQTNPTFDRDAPIRHPARQMDLLDLRKPQALERRGSLVCRGSSKKTGGSRRSAHQLRRRDPANALDFIENFSGGQGFRFFPPKRSIGQAHFRITQNPLRTGTGQLHGQKKKRRKHRTGSHLLRTRSEWILQRHDPPHKKIFNPGSHLVPRRRECPYHKGCLRIPHVLPPS